MPLWAEHVPFKGRRSQRNWLRRTRLTGRLSRACSESVNRKRGLLPSSILLEGVLDRILDAADGVLNLAFGLIRLAFGLHLGIACHVADAFFEFTANVLGGTVNTIFINHSFLLGCRFNGPGVEPFLRHKTLTGAHDPMLERTFMPVTKGGEFIAEGQIKEL
jgi:hypothetical protein